MGGFFALGVMFSFGWLSGRIYKRSLAVILGQACYLISSHRAFGSSIGREVVALGFMDENKCF
jgi:hypothetical protein